MPQKPVYRFLLIAASGVVIAAVAIAGWFWRNTDVYHAIPDSAIVVMEVNDWKVFSGKLGTTFTGMQLNQTEAGKRLFSELQGMSALLGTDPSLQRELYSGRTVVSLHLTSASNDDYLFTLSLQGVSCNALLQRVQAATGVQQVKERYFKNYKLWDVTLKDGRSITFAALRGVLIFSYTGFLTESAVSAIRSGHSLAQDISFAKVKADIPGQHLYVNWPQLQVLLPVWIKRAAIPLFTDLTKTSGWSVYAPDFTQDVLQLQGRFDQPHTSGTDSTNAIHWNEALAIIPSGAAVVDIANNAAVAWEEDNLAASFFRPWSGNFHAFVTLEPLTSDFTEQNLFMLQMKDRQAAKTALLGMLRTEGSSVLPVDSFNGEEIYRLQSGHLINQLFGNNFCLLHQVYFMLTDRVAVFANNKDVMKLAVENITTHQTLVEKQLPRGYTTADRLVFVNLFRSANLLRTVLKDESSLKEFLSAFESITWTTSQTSSTSVTLTAIKSSPQHQGTIWKTQGDALLTGKPIAVQEADKPTGEIMVQDTANNLYLLTAAGEIVFKRAVDGACVSDVSVVDYYHNGGRQYLFNTARHVFLLDSKGQDVAAYPMRLSAMGTAGLRLWKTGSGAVRYVVPCERGSVYGYELSGKPLAGWSPNRIAGEVTDPVLPFSVSDRSYVAITTTAGRLLLCDEKGNKQWSTTDQDTVLRPQLVVAGNKFFLLTAHGTQLVQYDARGHTERFTLLDSVSAFTAFSLSDTAYRYVYAAHGALRAYDQNNLFLAAAALPGVVISELVPVQASGQWWVVAVDHTTGQCFVLDKALRLLRSFDAVTTTPQFVVADLFGTNEPVRVRITSDGQVSCER